MSLESIPIEIVFEIMDRMRLKECYALACVNKYMSKKLYAKNDRLIRSLRENMRKSCEYCRRGCGCCRRKTLEKIGYDFCTWNEILVRKKLLDYRCGLYVLPYSQCEVY